MEVLDTGELQGLGVGNKGGAGTAGSSLYTKARRKVPKDRERAGRVGCRGHT